MRTPDLLMSVVSNLIRMRWRLVLTLLGVVIGTVSVVLMVAVGAGLDRSLSSMFSNSSTATKIDVQPPSVGAATGPTPSSGSRHVKRRQRPLNAEAVRRLKAIDGVETAIGQVSVPAISIKMNGASAIPLVSGVDMGEMRRSGYRIMAGRFPNSSREILVGSQVPDSFGTYDGSEPKRRGRHFLGRTVILTLPSTQEQVAQGSGDQADVRVRVVGILEAVDPMTDMSTFVPLAQAQSLSGTKTFDTVGLRARSTSDVKRVVREVKELGYAATSYADTQKLLGSVMKVVQVALGFVGGIALFVSALGIANTMTTAILERTKEIGIMMAIGASRRTIHQMFLMESLVIGFIGGVVGIVISWAVAGVSNTVIAALLIHGTNEMDRHFGVFYIPVWLALFALCFSTSVGLLAGLLPAARAARLNPVAAIRRE